jgi:hypothetical protein
MERRKLIFAFRNSNASKNEWRETTREDNGGAKNTNYNVKKEKEKRCTKLKKESDEDCSQMERIALECAPLRS